MPKPARILSALTVLALATAAAHASPQKRNLVQRNMIRSSATGAPRWFAPVFIEEPPVELPLLEPLPPVTLRLDHFPYHDDGVSGDNPPPHDRGAPRIIGILNTSSAVLYAKPERTGEAHPILPGETYTGAVDGFSTPDGRIYKVVDWFNTRIEVGDDAVRLSAPPGLNRVLGGGILKRQPDDGWRELFEKARPRRL
ncbi:MAG: hypothetical protein LBR12_02250 [Opitutaceae bacterium]|jgi:hypothetical protein|nr:hypothetical protein [Opitutaceae bacterium]